MNTAVWNPEGHEWSEKGDRKGDRLKGEEGDFPDGPGVKNLPSNEGAMGSIPGWGTKIPNDPWLLNLSTTTNKPVGLKEEPTAQPEKERKKQRRRLETWKSTPVKSQVTCKVKEGHAPTGIHECART